MRFADVIVTARALDDRASMAFVYDFRNERRPIEDVWLSYGDRPIAVVFGNHKEPFSMQALNGSPDRTLAEAAIPQALAPDRAVGASLAKLWLNASVTAGVFAGNINDRVTTGWSAGARATIAPVLGGRDAIHLGAAVNRRDPEGRDLSFSAFPATVRSRRPLIETGPISGVDEVWRFGAEAALKTRSVAASGRIYASLA